MTTVINGYVLEGMSTGTVLDSLNTEGGTMTMNHKDMGTETFMRKFSRELGRNKFSKFMSDCAAGSITWQAALAADLDKKVEEITWKDLATVYRKMKASELHRTRVEVADLESDSNEYSKSCPHMWDGFPMPRVSIVRVINCVL